MPARITVAELVGRALAALGAGDCFGVVGSGNFEVTNALVAAGVPYTAMRHEGGAATAADAYARMSGRVGLVSVHQGCGLTNAATGIGEAAKSRTPMIVLAAETARAAVNSNFAMDQTAFAESVQATSARVNSGESALADTVRAFRTAQNERRTVVLNLPLDVQREFVDASVLDGIAPLPAPERVRPSDASVAALTDLIEAAKRPVIIAGRGARHAGAELRTLGESAGALLATSAVAKGLFNGDAFDLGISGGFSSPTTAALIQNADLILGFGCALNMWTMRHGNLIGEQAKVVQVDLEDAALGRNRSIDLGVLGDAASTALDVTRELQQRGGSAERYRTPNVRERIAATASWLNTPYESLSTDTVVDPRDLTKALDARIPAERTVSIDSGNFMGYPSQFLRVPDEYGFAFTQAFQSIGLGLATAIGAARAQPDRLPVLGTGDGGFLMAIAEFETVCRLGLPMLIIVYNDAAYGAEVHHFGAANPDADMSTVTFPETDIAAIARGYGADAATVRTEADLYPVFTWLDERPDHPFVVDAKIASDGGSWWLQEAFTGH